MSRLVVCALGALLIVSGTACDLVVRNGESVELGNRGSVFGSSSSSLDVPPRSAVEVQPGGSLTVVDSDAFGGSQFPGPTEPVGRAASGISVLDGRLRVLQGRLQGGSVVFMEPSQLPAQLQVGVPGAGVMALLGEVEILGGTLVGGSVLTQPGQIQRLGGPGLRSSSSTRVTIRGGTFLAGATPGGVPAGIEPVVVELMRSRLEVSGGDFQGTFQVMDGNGVIRGGTFRRLQLGSPLIGGSGCTELRGGALPAIQLADVERLFIYGTGFNLPTGTRFSLGTAPMQVTGQLESGAPLNVMLVPTARPGGGVSGVITIAAPGTPGCV